MENASKALIIAGAILLAILIISLGIIIYRQAAGVVDNGSIDELEITTFNSKFTQYAGKNVKTTVVRTLIDQVLAYNAKNTTEAIEVAGTVTIDPDDPTKVTWESNWNPNETHVVEIGYDNSTGKVNLISIDLN